MQVCARGSGRCNRACSARRYIVACVSAIGAAPRRRGFVRGLSQACSHISGVRWHAVCVRSEAMTYQTGVRSVDREHGSCVRAARQE
eukprot:4135556-Pleurochrysis_carterae.AAC.2